MIGRHILKGTSGARIVSAGIYINTSAMARVSF